jgi:hypothetical protein
LALSARSDVNTRPFCDVWEGWNHQPINIREQQDAGEFLNMFLDRLPNDCQTLFKRTLVHTITGITEGYLSFNEELFFTLPIDIGNFPDIDASFMALLQSEQFIGADGLATEQFGRIDASKLTQIRTLPPILILHLKRFEYNVQTFIRYMVITRFAFPQQLDVSRLLEIPEDIKYQLRGVVLHSGTAQGGHSSSLIKINDDWFMFNDLHVSCFRFINFERETFGGQQTGNSAFLLFYSRAESTEVDQPIPNSIRQAIEQENREFNGIQAIFSKETLEFISECQSPDVMLGYLVKVFAHSNLEKEADSIKQSCMKRITSSSFVFNYLDQNAQKITEIHRNCSNKTILDSIQDFFEISIDKGKFSESIQNFVDKIFAEFGSFVTVWRQFNQISRLPLCLLRKWNQKIEDKRKWLEIVANLIVCFYRSDLSKNIKQSVDFTNFFVIMSILDSLSDPEFDVKFEDVTMSKAHLTSYFIYLLKLNRRPDFDEILAFYCRLRSDEMDYSEFTRFAVFVLSETDYDIVFQSIPKHSSESDKLVSRLIQELRKGNDKLCA